MSDYVRFRIKTGLDMYTVELEFSEDGETFEMDVYRGAKFHDGDEQLLEWIGGYEREPFSYVTKPVDLARELIETWERPKRLRRFLQLKNNFIHLNEEAESPSKATPLPEPVKIHDYAAKAQQDYIQHLIQHPEEVDTLPMQERKQLLKENIELRLRYHEWKALRKGGAKAK